MRIGVNISWMTPGHVGGMEWYIRNLIDQLGVIDAENTYVLVTAPNNAHTFRLSNQRWKKVVYFGYDSAPTNYRVSLSAPVQRSKAYRAARWVYRYLKNLGANSWRGKLNDHIRQENIDVWFCPLIYALPLDLNIPTVITIPDLQQEYHPNYFNEDEQAFRSMGYQYSCKVATAVIGISQQVATDIQNLYHIEPARTFGIPLALEHSYQVSSQTIEKLRNQVSVKYRLEHGYIFYPANGWPHKNHERLIEAIHILHQQGHHVRLVLTGFALDLMEQLQPLLCEYGIQDAVRHLGHVERHEIIGLYAASAMLVFPSMFEGFGLPLLEAMHFGIPVACSRIGSLPEVGGDAVLYFDPTSADHIADAIQQILTNAELCEHLVQAGKEQVSRFSYTTTAEQTLTIFDQIGNGTLSPPTILPFRPLIPHNWLSDGHGRWYFRSTSLQKILITVVQPLLIEELAQQHIKIYLNEQEMLQASLEPQRPYDFVIAVDNADSDFYRLDIIASLKFEAHGQQLSVRILNITAVESNNHELVLVK